MRSHTQKKKRNYVLYLSNLKALNLEIFVVQNMHFLKLEGKVGRRLLLFVYVLGDFSLPTSKGQPLVWRARHFIYLGLVVNTEAG